MLYLILYSVGPILSKCNSFLENGHILCCMVVWEDSSNALGNESLFWVCSFIPATSFVLSFFGEYTPMNKTQLKELIEKTDECYFDDNFSMCVYFQCNFVCVMYEY